MLFEIALNGLLLGGLYTLMGAGFSMQWGISGIINLSYGGMIVLGGYIAIGLDFFVVHLPLIKVILFGISILAVLLVYLFMNRTKPGKAIQASALNPDGARFIGINTERMYMYNFGIGCAIAAVAGALSSNINAFSVVLAGGLLGKVFVITVLGGLGNIWGAALGGITLGLVESFGTVTVGSEYNEALGLIVMVVVLVLRPRGLIGKKFWDV